MLPDSGSVPAAQQQYNQYMVAVQPQYSQFGVDWACQLLVLCREWVAVLWVGVERQLAVVLHLQQRPVQGVLLDHLLYSMTTMSMMAILRKALRMWHSQVHQPPLRQQQTTVPCHLLPRPVLARCL
eukprot:GHRQ01016082.1.p1 GENE.GHRQ01016082.1~~GHRQ01016082.1.p1  ORF type:complete len:126 (+),score=28.47 GHRQ01016082.1:60-437(+)